MGFSAEERCNMKIAIVNSKLDAAGVNIRRCLLEKLKPAGDEIKYHSHNLFFYESEGRLIYERGLDERLRSDLIIFISRHSGKDPLPALTVHVTGNYQNAMLGGEDKTLAYASPEFMHAVLNSMNKKAPFGYRVSYEVTHHGPTDLKTPSFFVEIGSTDNEWNDKFAGLAVSDSILEALRDDMHITINLVGFGASHYAARETEIALNSQGAFGHIAHTREAGGLSHEMILQMIEKSSAHAAYIDKKALSGSDNSRIEAILKELNIPVLSEGEIKDIGDIRWEKYLEIRKTAASFDSSCRIHIGSLKGTGMPVLIKIDPVLFEEALKTDEKEFIGSIKRQNAVYMSSQKGRILPIFITYEENRLQTINELISLCVKTLHKDKDTVVIDDNLVIRKTRFDPAKAAELGVPEGPFFGKLAAGFDVMAGGKKITPSMVSKYSEKVIRVPGLEKYL